ncbi:MAG: phospholipase, partial [Cyclobacteriaceae bacterium]|nr:phospholipase [Cyclobacteriaceae bacterium]
PIEKISIFKDLSYFKRLKFRTLKPGSSVSPLAVLATASDEPDYGHDIGLFEDVDTDYGKTYGFGNLPFGDNRFEFNTQAAFHMGFYHESGIVYKAAPFVKRTFSEYRIYQYKTLARYAFQTGHPYWGYRFAGWGLHHVQDLTQPFHSTLTPGIGTPRLLFTNIMSILGVEFLKSAIVKRMADRHNAVEKFHFEWMDYLSRNHNENHPMILGFGDLTRDAKYGPYDEKYTIHVLSQESNDYSGEFDSAIGDFPEIIEFMDTSMRYEKSKESKDRAHVERTLIHSMSNFGAHSRNYLRAILKK